MSESQEQRKSVTLPSDLMAKIRSSLDSSNSPSKTILHSVMNSTERYTDRQHLAEGAMKVIYECQDKVTGRQVAMAFPKHLEEQEAVEQFLREARVLTTLDHPNIIPVYDIGVDEEKPYFTMKLIHGESLEDLLKKLAANPEMDLASRLRLFVRVCEALAFAHSKGVVHLDLKPDNIQISKYGEVQVCDWGLAKLMNDCAETASVLLDDESLNFAESSLSMLHEGTRGTPGYMAPEQISESDAAHDRRTDIYSLGALLYSLITLRKPVVGSLDEILEKTKNGDIQSPDCYNADCAGSLAAICMKALAISADDRYQKVDDLLEDLHAYMGGFATNAEDAGFIKQLKLFYGRNKLACNLSIFALVTISVLSIVFVSQLKDREQKALFAEKEARASEAKAKASLEAFLTEQRKSKVLTGGIDTQQLTRSGNWSYLNLDLKRAKNFAKAVLMLQPDSLDANTLLGKALCLEQKFAEALPYLEKAERDIRLSLLPICRKFKDRETRLSADEFKTEIAEFIARLHKEKVLYRAKHFSWNRISLDIVLFTAYAFRRYIPLEENIDLLEMVMTLENQEAEIVVKVTKTEEGELSLDVSDSKNLQWTYTLTYLPISHLDLGLHKVRYRKPLFRIDINKSKNLKSVALAATNDELILALKREEKKVILNLEK